MTNLDASNISEAAVNQVACSSDQVLKQVQSSEDQDMKMQEKSIINSNINVDPSNKHEPSTSRYSVNHKNDDQNNDTDSSISMIGPSDSESEDFSDVTNLTFGKKTGDCQERKKDLK